MKYKNILRFTLPVLLLAFVALWSGCAYFNSFYLAQKHFKDAEFEYRLNKEQVTSQAKSSYDAAIKWSSEVYHNYPDSRYVDDSLFIIGMASYRIRDYVTARNVFNRLIEVYPESDYFIRSKFYYARTLIGLDRLEDATIILNELTSVNDSEIRGKAGLALAEIAFAQEDWEELLRVSESVLASDPDDEEKIKAMIYKGRSLFQFERYEDAISTLLELKDQEIDTEARFDANTIIAQSMAHIGSYDEAIQSLSIMENRGEFVPFEPRIRLEMGKIQELRGEDDVAIDTYKRLAGDYPDSLAAKEAWYRVGSILITDLANADEARDAFEEVQASTARTEAQWLIDSQIKIAQIDTMIARRELIASIEDDPERLAHARFSLAELYRYSFERPDSAATEYRHILEESPDSEYAVMSKYFLLQDEKASDGDFTDSEQEMIMRQVVDEYPESDFAGKLKVELGEVQTPPDLQALRHAEQAKEDTSDPDVYIPLYEQVVADYPGTKSAYQARFILAYVYEHEMNDMELALDMYQKLAEEEPGFVSAEYVDKARAKLSFYQREPELLAQIQRYLDGYVAAQAPTRKEEIAEEVVPGIAAEVSEGYNGMQKIRARNARIRSRYYSD